MYSFSFFSYRYFLSAIFLSLVIACSLSVFVFVVLIALLVICLIKVGRKFKLIHSMFWVYLYCMFLYDNILLLEVPFSSYSKSSTSATRLSCCTHINLGVIGSGSANWSFDRTNGYDSSKTRTWTYSRESILHSFRRDWLNHINNRIN